MVAVAAEHVCKVQGLGDNISVIMGARVLKRAQERHRKPAQRACTAPESLNINVVVCMVLISCENSFIGGDSGKK